MIFFYKCDHAVKLTKFTPQQIFLLLQYMNLSNAFQSDPILIFLVILISPPPKKKISDVNLNISQQINK